MKYRSFLTVLILLITCLSLVATTMGIFSSGGPGQYTYTSIRGKQVEIYGKGIYRDMSAEVAPQGIAQDYVTLFFALPLLLISFVFARSESLKSRLVFIGVLKYFFITYLFYTVMAMYNRLFPVYVMLMGSAFYALILAVVPLDLKNIHHQFTSFFPRRLLAAFLIFNSTAIILLWLSIIIPPLLDGTVIPLQVEHYTTLIVRGLDLGILLPGAIITGILFFRNHSLSFFLAPVYFIFLSILMTALTSKVVGMYLLGYNVIPVIFIIPIFAILSWVSSWIILRAMK
jgi:hypothetical protein